VDSEGVARVRPPGLGSDSGFGGGVGVIALPGTLALLATSRRRRWIGAVLCLGALVAVVTSLGRLQVVGSVVAMASFALLSLSAGRRVTRPLGALLAIFVLALPLGALFVTAEGSSVFSRYTSIAPENVSSTATSYKEKSLTLIPHYISAAPFGFGLASTGPAASFAGNNKEVLEGHGITAETQYNYVVDELGAPGLVLFVALLITIFVLAVRRLPRIEDIDVRIDLAAVFAVIMAYSVMGLRGAFMDTSSAAPYFWFAVGIAAYWLAGDGGRPAQQPDAPPQRAPQAIAAPAT
jgi:O-antigen ligase